MSEATHVSAKFQKFGVCPQNSNLNISINLGRDFGDSVESVLKALYSPSKKTINRQYIFYHSLVLPGTLVHLHLNWESRKIIQNCTYSSAVNIARL
jgi:hypothetical protein